MRASHIIVFAFIASFALGQGVPPYTAEYYLATPEKYLGKEITLAVAYVIPSNRARDDGMQEMQAITYNMNEMRGELTIVAPPKVAERVVWQCGTNRGRVSPTQFIKGIFKKEETKMGRYYLFIKK